MYFMVSEIEWNDVFEIFWLEIEINYSICKSLFSSRLPTHETLRMHLVWTTRHPSLQWMTWKVKKMKLINVLGIVKYQPKNVIFDIEEMLGLEQGVLSFNISYTRCIYSPYAINYSQFVNYLTILTRKYIGNVKSNAV